MKSIKLCVLLIMFFLLIFFQPVAAQFATVGSGLLLTERPLEPVAELNVQTAPFFNSRAYITLSWTDASVKPTIITAAEHSLFAVKNVFDTSLGAGLLLIEPKNYKPDFMLVSSTSVPLPVDRTAFVLIGSLMPFEKFEWSVVLKIGWAIWFLE